MAATAAVAPAGLPAAGPAVAPAATPAPKASASSSSRPRSSSSTRSSRLSWSKVGLTPPRKPDVGDLGGFLAGLVGYALFLSYIRYGPGGPKGWVEAKFINKPMTLTASSSSTSSSSSSASSSSYLVGILPGAGYSTTSAEV